MHRLDLVDDGFTSSVCPKPLKHKFCSNSPGTGIVVSIAVVNGRERDENSPNTERSSNLLLFFFCIVSYVFY